MEKKYEERLESVERKYAEKFKEQHELISAQAEAMTLREDILDSREKEPARP